MLYGLVRPVKRSGSRIPQLVKRIPSDLLDRMRGRAFDIPLGEEYVRVVVGPTAESIRFSLRTADSATAKICQAIALAHLEKIFKSLRADAPIELTREQVAALAGDIYREWEGSGAEEESTQVEYIDGKHVLRVGPIDDPELESEGARKAVEFLERLDQTERPEDKAMLDRAINPLIDQVLSRHGIGRVTERCRQLLFRAFLNALKAGLAIREKHVQGDFTPDPKAASYPEFQPLAHPPETEPARAAQKVSLKGLVESWWTEAKARGLKPSTHESYQNTMAAFVAFLDHDDATRVTPKDVIAFKDYRLATINPRTGKPISAKTVKDSDIAGLKSVLQWAVENQLLPSNPAADVRLKLGKAIRLRDKGFTDEEAKKLLSAALSMTRGREAPTLFAAKRWVPWVLAYTGARVGEIGQLRKEDVRKVGDDWVIRITPEAGTVKTNEAREVPLHPHLIELGFAEFVTSAKDGHLFLKPREDGDVLGPLSALKNRLSEAARAVVSDKNVSPNHGWRHRFKTVGLEAGIDHRILDAIQGHAPKTQGESYGSVTLKTKAAAIRKLPRCVVELTGFAIGKGKPV
jgi:integrase